MRTKSFHDSLCGSKDVAWRSVSNIFVLSELNYVLRLNTINQQRYNIVHHQLIKQNFPNKERMRLPKIKGRNAACITPSVVFNYTLRPTLCPLNYFHRFTPFSRVVGVMISKLIFISVPKIHHAHITPKIYIVPTITPTEQTTFQEMSTKYQCVPICIYSSCRSHWTKLPTMCSPRSQTDKSEVNCDVQGSTPFSRYSLRRCI